MRMLIWLTIFSLSCAFRGVSAADLSNAQVEVKVAAAKPTSSYYWQTTAVGNSALLLTLFCRTCETAVRSGDIPLISVMRDSLGDESTENDRLTSVWLLSYTPYNFGQRMLSAVPFFYWRVGDGSDKVDARHMKPLMDLTVPEHPMISKVTRDIVQWCAFDPLTMPVRASSRAYQSNETEHERLHLGEAIGYLHQAPAGSPDSALTQAELNTLIARLELRKRLLGGLVSRSKAEEVGQKEGFEQERIRSKNWELLRLSADKTGLLFEPINIGGTEGEYGLLWFPLDEGSEPIGTALGPLWKVLDLKNPWTDTRLKEWHGPVFTRAVDQNGSLLPEGSAGARNVQLIPLGAYSLNYPKLPLLLVDFRGQLHVRRHEMTQRTINEVTAGIIGISHFTNWYYYVAADVYDFVASRHGTAMDLESRLDCYSQFRVSLALDASLDGRLRQDMLQRIDSLSVNPLEGSPAREIQMALARYEILQGLATTEDGALTKQLDQQRRAELAVFEATPKGIATQEIFHTASLGFYNKRVKKDETNISKLDTDRRVQTNLEFLQSVVGAGTRPEIAYDREHIRDSVGELSDLLPQSSSARVRRRASTVLGQLKGLTQDDVLQADCSSALQAIERIDPESLDKQNTGIVADFFQNNRKVIGVAEAGQ